jgi:tRNA (cytosine34-C5)-methyltransferase
MPRGRHGRKRKPDTWDHTPNQDGENGGAKRQHTSYATIIKENALFEKYYKQLDLIEPSEFDAFMNVLKQPLPITFRITSYKSFSGEVLNLLKEKHFKYIDEITKNENAQEVIDVSAKKGASLLSASKEDNSFMGDDKEIYKQLSWYPNQLGWQVNLSRQDVRKNQHFEEFKQFLIHHTQNGLLNRQEAVSMIPPLLLDVQPHHKILDMCASPGSKTAQLIEFLHSDPSNPVPEGFVIANDLENKRCYMLMHQLKRLESPNFMIINHDASSLPNFRAGSGSESFRTVQFDRILADVPCSGDGTFRKNIDVWTKWTFSHACNLHGIQSRIAKRAAELLAPGGTMVYSTCSLNPVENEAVVYNLLLKFKDLELVEARDKLTGMRTTKGMYKWNCMSKAGDLYETVEDVAPEFRNLIRPYMFPPEESVAKELNLERCIRILPHHQNTGGFFIAVIRKKASAAAQTENVEGEAAAATTTENQTLPEQMNKMRVMKAPPAKRVMQTFDENPFTFMDETNQLIKDWPKIK